MKDDFTINEKVIWDKKPTFEIVIFLGEGNTPYTYLIKNEKGKQIECPKSELYNITSYIINVFTKE